MLILLLLEIKKYQVGVILGVVTFIRVRGIESVKGKVVPVFN
jgi:hypothetical protein